MIPDEAKAAGRPLHGVRVLDMTIFLSGPFCTQILADLGAEVIKLEAPAGDPSRAIPPHFVGPDSAYYLAANRNKQSIALDLKTPGGLETAKRLVAASDVVVENFRPGVCTKLGLDPVELRRANPQLIWASISGFGQTGPNRDLPAYDMIVQAMSGVMSLTGEEGRPAARLGIPAGDIVAGMYAAIATVAALCGRHRTGEGQTIDISMLDGQLAMLSYQGLYALSAGLTPGRQGARHDSIPTYRSFTAGDGRELVVTANTERMWQGLCEALGLGDLASDPRFCDARRRLEFKEELWSLLEPAFLSKPAGAWLAEFSSRGVAAGPILTVPEALDAAAAGERDMVVPVEHADGRKARLIGDPIKFEGLPGRASFPPKQSEQAESILRKVLGLEDGEIAALGRGGAYLPSLDGPS